ncbi:MAG: 6-bladed beta-propeller, partial [Planctomycetes bacterium]|nr:6-bladed beta-propeller [Planctomycetota bacterium]
AFLRGFGTAGSQPGQFSAPEGLCVDRDGHMWVADTNNHRIQKFDILEEEPSGIAAEIGFPADGFHARNQGLVLIGRADSAAFASYELAYGTSASATEWTVIGTFARPVVNGTLGYWEFPAADGSYTLRLTVTETGGADLPPVYATVVVDRAPPEVFIGYPPDQQLLGSQETVQGRVTDANLAAYTLDYGFSATPASFTPIANGTAPIAGGDLAVWNTQGIANGVYTLRLTASDRAGNQSVHTRMISIGPVAFAGRIGTGVDGTANNQLSLPYDVARGPDGRLYVAEYNAGRIKVLNPDGSFVTVVGRNSGDWSRDLSAPVAVAVDSQNTIYAADGRNVVQVYRYQSASDTWIWSRTLGGSGSALGQFDYPTDLVVQEADGVSIRLYVVDSNNHRVQVLDLVAETWSRIGSYGKDYGQFVNPRGLALDAYGNLYVTDAGNKRIVLFDAGGNYISHFGQSGQIPAPWGIAADVIGNLYVSQSSHYGAAGVLKFNADGTLLLSFGPYGTSEGQLNGGYGLCVTADNTVYVANPNSHTVESFRVYYPPGVTAAATAHIQSPPEGLVTHRDVPVVGTASGPRFLSYVLSYGPGLDPEPDQMTVIAASDRSVNKGTVGFWRTDGLDDGTYTLRLEVSDTQSAVVFDTATVFIDRVLPVAALTAPASLERVSGVVSIAGTASDRHLAYYRLEYGSANDDNSWVSVARVDGVGVTGGILAEWNVENVPDGVYTLRLFVEDLAGNRAISSVLVSKGPAQYLSAFGHLGNLNGEFNTPKALARGPDGRIYALDAGNGRVQIFDADGGFLGTFGATGSGAGQLLNPSGLTIAADGRIFVVDTGNNRVQVFGADGTYLAAFGREGSGPGEFLSPYDVAIGADETIYVSDTLNNRVQIFTPEYALSGSFGVFGREPGDFYHPAGLACDGFGNVYVADTGNDRVQILDGRGGFIAQLGATGTREEMLMAPLDVALDGDGNVYVASTGESTIKKYRADGTYQIGFGHYGAAQGQLFEPAGLVVWGGGGSAEIYVADTRNHRVQHLRVYHPQVPVPGLAVALIAAPADGSNLRQRNLIVGTAYAPELTGYTVWLDDGVNGWTQVYSSEQPVLDGTLWYLDAARLPGASCSVKLQVTRADGTVLESPVVHLLVDQQPPQVGLTSPVAFSLVNGAVAVTGWVSDAQLDRFVLEYGNRQDDASWVEFGSGTQPVEGGTLGVWYTAYVPDGTYALRLTAVDKSGNMSRAQTIVSKGYVRYLSSFGIFGRVEAEMASPRDVVVAPDGEIFVLDSDNHRVQVFDAGWNFRRAFGAQGSGAGQLQGPGGIAVDPQGNIVVADTGNNRVLVFDPLGTVVKDIGSGGGVFSAPEGVAVDAAGKIYVADANNNRVKVLDPSGATLMNLSVSHPTGVAVDSTGKIFVAEPYNNRIVVFHAGGTLWKSFGTYGTGQENLHNPWDLAIDVLDNVFVVDKNNNRIKKYTTNGVVLTVYGSGGNGEGRFSSPTGVGTDGRGRVYVADTGNHRIQVLDDYGSGSDHEPPVLWLDPALAANLQGLMEHRGDDWALHREALGARQGCPGGGAAAGRSR